MNGISWIDKCEKNWKKIPKETIGKFHGWIFNYLEVAEPTLEK